MLLLICFQIAILLIILVFASIYTLEKVNCLLKIKNNSLTNSSLIFTIYIFTYILSVYARYILSESGIVFAIEWIAPWFVVYYLYDRQYKSEKWRTTIAWLIYLCALLAIYTITALFIRNYIAEPFELVSSEFLPIYHSGDCVLVSSEIRSNLIGDIVVYRMTSSQLNEKNLIGLVVDEVPTGSVNILQNDNTRNMIEIDQVIGRVLFKIPCYLRN